jgi:transposase InsO family protein
LGRNAKWEYFRTIYQRYRGAKRQEKQAILNEFCRNAGYHRKYAIRLLNGPRPGKGPEKNVRRRGYSYGPQALAILAEVWEAAGYPWSVRLKALLPKWLPWIRKRFRMSSEIERQLLRISARQMDRRLRAKKTEKKRRIYGRTKPGLLLKHQIAVKTDSWDVTTPGFTEVDLVSHSGNSADGEFAHTLNVTDIHTTWTESRAVLGKGQSAVKEALNEVERALPFRLLGVDSDNGSEFINWHLKAWCEQKQIQLTRGRPYKKDDNAHVEQKNWTHVRKLLGWERYDSARVVEAMNDLYRHELRLWMNLFLPSVKLVRKTRVGSKLRRVYDRPQTPLERVACCPQADPQRVAELKHLERTVDPFHLGQVIERKLDRIYQWANRRWSPKLVRANAGKPTGRANGCGKAAAWKPKDRVSTPLGNPANSAGFPLSHSPGGDGRSVTSQMSRQTFRKLHS